MVHDRDRVREYCYDAETLRALRVERYNDGVRQYTRVYVNNKMVHISLRSDALINVEHTQKGS